MTARTRETPTTSIDKDIMEKAREIVIVNHGIDIEGELQSRCLEMVCEALQEASNEERERCAKIAEAEMDADHDEWIASDMTDAAAGARHWKAAQIATAIRKGGE